MHARTLVVLFFVISIFSFGMPVHVLAYDAQTDGIKGGIEGEDTTFQIADSNYLNIGLHSSEVIKLRLESVPHIITMMLEPASASATSTQITIVGLVASTTYYKYEDSYHTLALVLTDENGSYTYTQDLSVPHLVFIQPNKSTKFIRNDATGGDCAPLEASLVIGIWDPVTLTCTLTTDLTETTEIDSDGITLDGTGHTTTGLGTGNGIYINGKSHVTIKNLTIKNFSYGIFLNASSEDVVLHNSFFGTGIFSYAGSSFTTIQSNTFQNVSRAGIFFSANGDTLRDNTISVADDTKNSYQGISFYNSHSNTIASSTFSNLDQALFLYGSYENTIASSTFSNLNQALFLNESSYDNTITNNAFSNSKDSLFLYHSYGNTVTNNTLSGANRALFLFSAHDNTIAKNTFASSTEALFVYESSYGNTMYHNNFLRNGTNVMDYSDMSNAFSLPKPAGGNYFDSFDESSEGCDDVDADGMCDASYVFAQDHDAGRDILPWTMQNGWGDAPIAHISNHSSVLFLPGIEGSRLYEGTGCGKKAEEKLWEPVDGSLIGGLWGVISGAGDAKVDELALDQDGESVCDYVYTKEGDIIDSVGGGNIYASLISEMNGLKSAGTIKDWKPIAYDWRLSLDDILNKGVKLDEKIFYEATTTSAHYIEQTLRALAKNSKTGKVTIVAHSNGGLVAKALLDRLGDKTAKSLVDKVIMVGVPQSGAPADVGSLLVGYNAGIYQYGLPIVSNVAARTFTQNSPMAYHLLPSQKYFTSIIDEPTHPVVHFSGDGYAKERAAYGNSIVDASTLDDFLLAAHEEREKPAENNLSEAEILNTGLLEYANSVHDTLDSWTPPTGIEVDQIAGWGVDTVAGVDFYTQSPTDVLSALDPTRLYRPITVEDGDGTVPVPSALMMASSTNVKRYWVNLFAYNNETHSIRNHSDLFEIPSLQDFIKNIITNSISSLPTYISSTQPSANNENKKLTFYLHSPLTLEITDSSGKVTGLALDNSVTQDIPGSTYGEFGEVKYVSVPEGGAYTLSMHGQASGTFSLDMQESLGGIVTALSTIAIVPTTAGTLASLNISGGIDTASPLIVDENGDGKDDFTITPRVGEVVTYDQAVPVPEPVHVPAPQKVSSPGSISIPYIAPPVAIVIPAEAIMATTSILGIATSSLEATTIPVRSIRLAIETAPLHAPIKKSTALKKEVIIPQTASVYEASKQSALKKLGAIVYNGLQGFWTALKKFF